MLNFIGDQSKEKLSKISDALASNPVLAYFDPTQQTEVHVDSSKFGIGCVLVQKEHPIAYGSCALTPTQQKYSLMEKRNARSTSWMQQIPSIFVWSKKCPYHHGSQATRGNLQERFGSYSNTSRQNGTAIEKI